MLDHKIALFEGKRIRRHWDNEKELWYFSVVDAVAVLTGSTIPRRYWSDLKIKLQKEGSEVYEKIVQLKMRASDGKYYQQVELFEFFKFLTLIINSLATE